MGNGPIFEWSPGNIILEDQEDKEVFDNMVNYLQHHHNNDNDSNYVTDGSGGDYDRLGSREAEYTAMDE